MSLSQSSINAAYSLAALVTRKGKTVGVTDESAIGDVMRTCDVQDDGIMVIDGDFGAADDTQPEVHVKAITDGDDHCAEMERLVDLAARATSFTMDVARNQVTPKVKKVVEATEAYIDARRSAKLEPLLIESRFIAPVYESADMRDLIGKHEKSPYAEVPPQTVTAKWAGLESLSTGIGELDEQVKNHFAGREEEAKRQYQRYFSKEPGLYRDADFRNDIDSPDDALVIFLGAGNLLEADEVPEDLPTDLASYRAYLSMLKDQAGATIAHQLRTAKSNINANQLVISAPRPTRPGETVSGKIVVHGPVYNQWLSEGGSPEALCGAVMAGAGTSYGTTLEGAEAHASYYERHLNVLNAQAVFELRAVTIQGLKEALLALINEMPQETMPTAQINWAFVIGDQLSRLTTSDLENLYKVAQDLICDNFYGHTDAKAFLEALNAAAGANAGMDIREVALLVTIDYVTSWVASGIYVTDAGAGV
jgi:hypothetical protein